MIEQLICVGLAGWRIASMLSEESGPWDIFERIRLAIGLGPGEVKGFLPNLFACMMCLTVWTSLLMYGVWLLAPAVVVLIATMGLAIMADTIIKIRNNG